MSRIAAAQQSGLQVEHTHEEGYEDTRLVAFARVPVDISGDLRHIVHMTGRNAELTERGRHHQCGWHTLARDITDAEEEFTVAEDEVIEVASHLTGRCQ